MKEDPIIEIVRRFYPDVQAIYLFGSYGTALDARDSDLDIALLFSHDHSQQIGGPLLWNDCSQALELAFSRSVDLVNIRLADTVFQNEVLSEGRLLLSGDEAARQEFEMLALSLYQKLQQERLGILEQIQKSKRVYNV